jgi:hypothetical protein
MAFFFDDNEEEVALELPLDKATRDWLAHLSVVTGSAPEQIVASMLRDIRIDDEQAHQHTH